jgi:ADP-heptose:LPS heptosyltransferase
VNTSTVHIAAALQRPVIVLYAETNPQHTPWLTKKAVLYYSIPEQLQSKNEVIQFVNQSYYKEQIDYPSPERVADVALNIMETLFHYNN